MLQRLGFERALGRLRPYRVRMDLPLEFQRSIRMSFASDESHPIVMGSYGIGIGRLLAAAIEQNHDDKGIIWPMSIAPYHIYLCPLYLENS